MNKKIFLMFAFFMASVFVKAQISSISYPSGYLSEEKIKQILSDAKKNGISEKEYTSFDVILHRRLKQQEQDILNGAFGQKIAPNPPQVLAGGGCVNPGFETNDETGWTFTQASSSAQTLPCPTCFNAPGPGAGASPGGVYEITTAGATSASNNNPGNTANGDVSTSCWCLCTEPYTAGKDFYGNFPVVAPAPLGGVHSLLLNNANCGALMQRASYSFVVNPANVSFTFQYAVVLNAGGHVTAAAPYFQVSVLDLTLGGAMVPCTSFSATAGTDDPASLATFTVSPKDANVYYRSWTTVTQDLSSIVGHTVTVQFDVSDCNQTAHFGYAYIDASCNPLQITKLVALCPGQPAVLSGPPGMGTYSWSPGGATTQNITTSTAGNYTLATTNVNGCPSPLLYYNLVVDPAPVPNFSSSSPPCSGNVTFVDGSTVPTGTITNWVWNYGDGSAPVNATTAANQTHLYSPPGAYTVTLTDTTDNKCAATYTFVVNSGGGGPNPSFSSNSPATAPQCLVGNNVIFTNASTITGSVTISGYNWDFGDGTTGTSTTATPNTSHSYTASGTYVVTLTVNVTGCSSTTTQTVVISPMPTATISAPPVCVGAPTVFTSTITNGGTYMWDYGDPAGTPVAGTPTPSHTYALPNTYTVNLTVTSPAPASCTVTTTTNVIVSVVPTASFSVAPVCMGIASVFDASASTPTVGATYSWNFGGAAPNTDVVTTQTDNHTYTSTNTFPVTLTVTVGSCSATTTGNAVVNPFPVLGFTANHPCDGSALNITNTTTNPATISNWSWNLGDGTAAVTTATPPAHTYSAAGCYSVVLTATASTGCSGSHDTVVYVHPNPAATFTALEACLGTPSGFIDGSTVKNLAPCLTDQIVSWSYDLGDGTVMPFTAATIPTGAADTIKHTYAACGPKNITVTVTTNNGCINVATLIGDTVFCPPTVVGPIDFTVCPGKPTPVQTFTTTCANGGNPTSVWFQSLTNVDNTGAPASFINPGGNDQVPSYNAIAANLNCGLLKDTVFAIPYSGVGCRGTPTYYIANVWPTPTVTPVASVTVCANATVPAISFTGCPGAAAPETFNWVTGGTNIGLASPGAGNIPAFTGVNATSLVAVGTVTVTPTANTCVGPPTTFSITVDPIPVITITSPNPYCPKDTVSSIDYVITPTPGPPATVTYTWTATNNAGTGMPAGGTGAAPGATYTAPANPSQVNQISVVTYTPSLNGCIGLPVSNTVTVKPTPTMVAMPDQSLCPALTTTVVPFSINPVPTGTSVVTYTYSYNLGGGIPTTVPNVNSFPPQPTSNTGLTTLTTSITVVPTLDGCVGPPSGFSIFVYPNPIANFSFTHLVCESFPMNFTDLSVPNTGTNTVNGWAWSMNTGNVDYSVKNPNGYVFPAGVIGAIPVTLTVTTVNSCTAVTTETVYVNPNPVPDFAGDNLKSCPNLYTTFSSSLTVVATPTTTPTHIPVLTYNWTFGNGHTSTSANPPVQTYTNSSPTQSAYYDVTLTVKTDSFCVNKVTKTKYLQVYPRPIANFAWGPNDADIDNSTIFFTNEAQGASPYVPVTYGPKGVHYYLGDIYASNPNFNSHDGSNVIGDQFSHTYEHYDTATYYVTQWVINNFGCRDTITKPVHIGPNFTFYIPNAFSPNGDGTNEGFKGLGVGIDNTTYNLWVFDRWGLMIFYANDIDKSWDGHMHGNEGKPVLQEDVYVWKVKFNDFTGKKHEYHGTVTLLK
jgi:gliding motility-associated-like protein